MLTFLLSCSPTPETKCCPEDDPALSTAQDTSTDVVEESSQQDSGEEVTEVEAPPEGFVDCSECIDGNPSHRRYGIAVTDFTLDDCGSRHHSRL